MRSSSPSLLFRTLQDLALRRRMVFALTMEHRQEFKMIKTHWVALKIFFKTQGVSTFSLKNTPPGCFHDLSFFLKKMESELADMSSDKLMQMLLAMQRKIAVMEDLQSKSVKNSGSNYCGCCCLCHELLLLLLLLP